MIIIEVQLFCWHKVIKIQMRRFCGLEMCEKFEENKQKLSLLSTCDDDWRISSLCEIGGSSRNFSHNKVRLAITRTWCITQRRVTQSDRLTFSCLQLRLTAAPTPSALKAGITPEERRRHPPTSTPSTSAPTHRTTSHRRTSRFQTVTSGLTPAATETPVWPPPQTSTWWTQTGTSRELSETCYHIKWSSKGERGDRKHFCLNSKINLVNHER